MRLTQRAIEAIRREPGRALILVLTDRCGVGCDHCNVDSRPDSPTVEDFERFEALLAGLCADPELELLTITGGEPFLERRALALATRRLRAAGKRVAVATSGVWATGARVAGWIHDVLARCDCVILSTDSFHRAKLDDSHLINAARESTAADAWLILQTLDEDGARERGAALLNQAFGGRWDQHAEINLIAPLRQGRATQLFAVGERSEARSFGACPLLRTPTVRYDGAIAACANEEVARGLGPRRLRRRAQTAAELREAIAALRRDPALQIIAEAGFGKLLRHEQLREVATRRFSSICELCDRTLARLPERGDPQIDSMATEIDEPQ